jgi:hypothetical protein
MGGKRWRRTAERRKRDEEEQEEKALTGVEACMCMEKGFCPSVRLC